MPHRGGQTGNQNARAHGIYSRTHKLTESELADIADLAVTERNIQMLTRLLSAPAYADKPEKRRAIRQLIRTLIASDALATTTAPTRSIEREPTPKPRIAIGHSSH